MSRAERLLNLMMYLLASRSGASADEIRFEVEGYSGSVTDDAFLRMFERDKEDLREAGVPIVTEPNESGESAYRIDRDAYYLAPIALTPPELAGLNLAAGALTEDPGFPMRDDLRHAFLKLTTQSQTPPVPAGRLSVRLLGDEEVRSESERVGRVLAAIRRRKRVRFTYHSMRSGSTEERELEPYGLYYSSGAWYAVGRDVDRDEVRTFRLSRVQGGVEVSTKAPHAHDYEVPAGFDVRHHGDRPWKLGNPEGPARVRFAEPVAWMAEREVAGSGSFAYAPDGSGMWELDEADHEGLVRWLLRYGDRAELLEPAADRRRLSAMLDEALSRTDRAAGEGAR